MKTNMDKKERIIRFVIAVVIVALASFFLPAGWDTAAYILGGVVAVTSAFGFCPAYMACPVSFGKKKTASKPAAKKKKK